MRSNSINKISQKKIGKEEIIPDEKINLILKDITLARPGSSFNHFIKSQTKLIKTKNKDIKLPINESSSSLSEKWYNLKDSEKEKYQKLYEEDKKRYFREIELVRHYLFKDFNDQIFKAPTAYRIFLNEKYREGFEQNLDPKEVEKNALIQWREMPINEKRIYKEKKKSNDIWFLEAKKITKINPISLFTKIKFEKARKMHNKLPTVEEIILSWKELSDEKKKIYKKYAQKINDKKEKLQDLYDIIHGVKPKKPSGALICFLKEKAMNNEMKDLKEMIEIWKKLSEEEKEKYLLKSHRYILAYKYKKMIYDKKIKRFIPKKPIPLNIFLQEKKGQKAPDGENWSRYWTNVFRNLSGNEKKKFEEKFKKYEKEYEKKMLQFENKVFDLPKKPNTGYNLYLSERFPVLKEEKPNEANLNIINQIAEEWTKGEIFDKKDYLLKAEIDRDRFKKQLNEFEKFGYYTKSDKIKNEENFDNEDNDEIEKRKKKIKKRNVEYNFQGTKKNKNNSSKGQDSPERNNFIYKNKNIKKSGKSQKYKDN